MDYVKTMALIAELKALMTLLQSPDSRWQTLQDWLTAHPKWRKLVNHYVKISPDEAAEDLKAYLIEQTGAPEVLANAFITPQVRASAILSIKRLQEMYKARKAEDSPSRIEISNPAIDGFIQIDVPTKKKRKPKSKSK